MSAVSTAHSFVSPYADDGSDATRLKPSNWNADHKFSGGATGSLLMRDTGVSQGASWLDDIAVGSVLVSGGVGIAAAWSASPSVASLTLTGALNVGDGSVSTPSMAPASEPGLGFYKGGAGQLALAQGGQRIFFWNNGGFALSGDAIGVYFGAGQDTVLQRGGAAGKLQITGTTPMLQLGGTTSAFPAWKQVSSNFQARTADDAAYVQVTAASFAVSGNTAFVNGTAPTISSGFGTGPSITSNNGTVAFTINVGTGGVASSGVIGLPATANGWVVFVQNLTAQAANRGNERTVQTASTTSTATVQNQLVSTGAAQVWAASDILHCIAIAR